MAHFSASANRRPVRLALPRIAHPDPTLGVPPARYGADDNAPDELRAPGGGAKRLTRLPRLHPLG